jgi:hypothetical protein
MTRPKGRVVLTAPTAQQVERILWREVRSLYANARFKLGGKLYETPYGGLKWDDGREIFGRTAKEAEGFQGLSGANQLVIIDEGSGFPEHLFEPAMGNLSGGGSLLMTGNPTRPSGTFYDSHHTKRGAWCTLHLSSLDTPNHHGGIAVPGLSDPSTLDFYREQWGEGTPAWDVRVLGNFPSSSADTIISLALAEDAQRRYDELVGVGALSIGVDPARFGDDRSCICIRRGYRVLCECVLRNVDGPDLAGAVLESIARFRDGAECVSIKVDVVGIGASCFDVLARRARDDAGMSVHAIVGNASPTSQPSIGPGYHDLNTQMWFGARDWLREGGALPANDVSTEWSKAEIRHAANSTDIGRREGELVGRIYKFDAQGRYQIEAKSEFKKRIGRSPDGADAMVYSIYEPPPMGQVRVSGKRALAGGLGGF